MLVIVFSNMVPLETEYMRVGDEAKRRRKISAINGVIIQALTDFLCAAWYMCFTAAFQWVVL